MTKQNNALKVTISGSYLSNKKEHIDFDSVRGVIPFCSEELATAMTRARYAGMWLTLSKAYPESVMDVREVFIDKMEPITHEFSYVGKNIMELTYEELQDFATAKDLRAVPLYKASGLRQSRTMAYVTFANQCLGWDVDHRQEGFNIANEPPLTTDADIERAERKTISNDEMLEIESTNTHNAPTKKILNRDQLEQMAKKKNISFNSAITDEKLQEKVFNAG